MRHNRDLEVSQGSEHNCIIVILLDLTHEFDARPGHWSHWGLEDTRVVSLRRDGIYHAMAPRHALLKRAFSSAFQQVRSYSAPSDRSVPPAKQKYVPTSGTYPKGFLVGSAHAGVKASNTKYDDMALVVSETPCAATGVFTKNFFKAAPVQVSRQLLNSTRGHNVRGVVVNSGCANAVTGKGGNEDARAMANATDKLFGPDDIDNPQTMVMSTGVIGQRLPIEKITNTIPKLKDTLGSSHDHWLRAAQAICTTDTFPKLLSRTFTLPSHPETTYSIAGMTKGAGMIRPNMATLLGIVCTDAAVHPGLLRRLLRRANSNSFNAITIDGDTSTNDTVAMFASGAAAPPGTSALEAKPQENLSLNQDIMAFSKVLRVFMEDLAKLVVRDGEGATKFVTVRVQSNTEWETARRAASSIASSSLVKTALYGKDANWGRILCAVGYAPGLMDSTETPVKYTSTPMVVPERTSVSFVPTDGSEELKLLVRGEPEQVDEERAKQILEMEDLEILVRLDDVPGREGPPKYEAVVWTCDFSHEYVTINGDYRT